MQQTHQLGFDFSLKYHTDNFDGVFIYFLPDLKARIKSSRKKYKVEKKKKNRIKEGQPMEEGTDSQELFSSDDDDDEELDYIKKGLI